MKTEEEFVLGLILEEEMERVGDAPQDPVEEPISNEEEVFYIQREDVTLTDNIWYTPRSKDEAGDVKEMPLKASGELDNFLVITDTDKFRVRVELDNSDVINNDFQTLNSIQNELTHVSAYQKNSMYIVSVSGYPFSERLETSVRPMDSTVNINRIRTEAII